MLLYKISFAALAAEEGQEGTEELSGISFNIFFSTPVNQLFPISFRIKTG